ncbi:MAG: hypothetical protein HY685_07240 [Chloroflexi bacterium]|nr:hypothetical protein [Chloroflexota bacterium]
MSREKTVQEERTSEKAMRIGDVAVQAKTHKTWEQWFALLDTAGARSMSHTEIAQYLRKKHGVSGWWSQMVANTYEQSRGMRERHQMPEGYQVSVSKTFEAPVARLYQAWNDKRLRGPWLPQETITIRKATLNKSLRITWADGVTSVEVLFYEKGEERSQVVVQHSKLADPRQAESMKSHWKEALERLEGTLAPPQALASPSAKN